MKSVKACVAWVAFRRIRDKVRGAVTFCSYRLHSVVPRIYLRMLYLRRQAATLSFVLPMKVDYIISGRIFSHVFSLRLKKCSNKWDGAAPTACLFSEIGAQTQKAHLHAKAKADGFSLGSCFCQWIFCHCDSQVRQKIYTMLSCQVWEWMTDSVNS